MCQYTNTRAQLIFSGPNRRVAISKVRVNSLGYNMMCRLFLDIQARICHIFAHKKQIIILYP